MCALALHLIRSPQFFFLLFFICMICNNLCVQPVYKSWKREKGNSFSHNFCENAFKNNEHWNWTRQMENAIYSVLRNKHSTQQLSLFVQIKTGEWKMQPSNFLHVKSDAEVCCISLTQPMDLRNWIFHRNESKMHSFFSVVAGAIPSQCSVYSFFFFFLLVSIILYSRICFFLLLLSLALSAYFLQFLNICEAFLLVHAGNCIRWCHSKCLQTIENIVNST